MDSETAWANFKKNNQTSVEDKLDVLMAQQQEILTDTSRVADLVPLVTGDKAEEDALEETGELEQSAPETEPPMENMEENPEGIEDNPFAFLDEESDVSDEDVSDDDEYQSEDEIATDDDYEETDEESDVEDIVSEDEPEEELPDQTESEEEYVEDDTEDIDEPDTEDEEKSESEEASEESEQDTEEEEDYISFDEIDEEETKKSSPVVTKTIKSLSDRTPMTVVSKISRPDDSFTFGRANESNAVGEMLFKAQEDFEIGYGVDPHKVVEKDWADYRVMKKLNTF